jgi:hypothetical protein
MTGRPPGGSTAALLALVVVVATLHSQAGGRATSDGALDVIGCLSRPADQITVTGAGTMTALSVPRPPAEHTYDLRGTTLLGNQDPLSPDFNKITVNLGAKTPAPGTCVVGGFAQGTHSRDLDWSYFKVDPGGADGPAFRIGTADRAIVQGIRVDNMMDAITPLTDGLTVRHAYLNYVRDDCISDDRLTRITVEDSLFDGCFTAVSRKPDKDSPLRDAGPDTSLMELNRVLMRLEAMPGGWKQPPEVATYNGFWKWSPVTGPVVIRDSILMAGHSDVPGKDMDWPPNVTAHDVTLVWVGEGPYPGVLPDSGVTVTDDAGVWERAKADWLDRHGCRSVSDCDEGQLIDPGPDTLPDPVSETPTPAPTETGTTPTPTETGTTPSPTETGTASPSESTAPSPGPTPTPTEPTPTPTDPAPTPSEPSPTPTATPASPVLSAPATVAFGSQRVGTSSKQRVRIKNLGPGSLTVTTVGTAKPFAVVRHTCAAPLAKGAACRIVVRFAPTSKGTFTRALTITSNAASSPTTVTLTGKGT